MKSLDTQTLEEKKKQYKRKVHEELMRRGIQYEELLAVMSKTGFYEALNEYPEEQLLCSVEDTVDEILLTAARFNPRDGRNVDIKPLNNDSKVVIGRLRSIEKHPKLFLGDEYGIRLLKAVLYGISINREGTQWANISMDISEKFYSYAPKEKSGSEVSFLEWNMTDEEMFHLWYKCFHEVVDPLLEEA
jgi:hypothetical protein